MQYVYRNKCRESPGRAEPTSFGQSIVQTSHIVRLLLFASACTLYMYPLHAKIMPQNFLSDFQMAYEVRFFLLNNKFFTNNLLSALFCTLRSHVPNVKQLNLIRAYFISRALANFFKNIMSTNFLVAQKTLYVGVRGISFQGYFFLFFSFKFQHL